MRGGVVIQVALHLVASGSGRAATSEEELAAGLVRSEWEVLTLHHVQYAVVLFSQPEAVGDTVDPGNLYGAVKVAI